LPKLKSDGLATTLRAGTSRDHGSFTSARPIHYRYPRVITVREAARLHSFPDWFQFHITKWHAFQQIGNSVPPFLAEAVAQSIVLALGCSPEKVHELPTPSDKDLLRFSLEEAARHYGIDFKMLPKESRANRKKKAAQKLD
jgi:DNA (cytosine-5)-methyltransferase 1